MKVAEAASRYMDDKRGRLRACTLAGYESALTLHVLPRWGELELEAITPEDVQSWIDSFELPGAAEKAYKTLRQVIRWAIRRLGVRMYDPTAVGVELPHKPAHRPRTMEASQVRAYLRALWGHECEAVAICSITLGLRRGEACGLKWSDIDLRTGEVRIRRSRQVVRGNEVVEAPKTERSARSCWLPRFAVKRLRAAKRPLELAVRSVARRHRAAHQVCMSPSRSRLDLDDGMPSHVGDARRGGWGRHRDRGHDARPYRHRDGLRALHRAEAAHLQGCAARGRAADTGRVIPYPCTRRKTGASCAWA